MQGLKDMWKSERRARWFFLAHLQGALGAGAGYIALLVLAYDRIGSAWGAADQLREARGTTRQPDEQRFGERVEAELRAALGADGFAAALAEGGALELDEAVSLGLRI